MKIIFKISFILSIIVLASCKPSNNVNKENLYSFFSKTDWKDFNENTFKDNNLEDFLINDMDFYHRQDFFELMKNPNYTIPYDDFYLVEIENLRTERINSRKIIIINNENEISYLFFKNAKQCKNKGNFSDDEINKYKYKNLSNGTSKHEDDYIMVTKIIKDTY